MKRQDTDRPSLQSILGFFALIILAIALAFIPLPGYPGGPMPDYPTRAESDADMSAHEADQSTHGCSEIASSAALAAHTGATTGVHGAPANTRFATASEAGLLSAVQTWSGANTFFGQTTMGNASATALDVTDVASFATSFGNNTYRVITGRFPRVNIGPTVDFSVTSPALGSVLNDQYCYHLIHLGGARAYGLLQWVATNVTNAQQAARYDIIPYAVAAPSLSASFMGGRVGVATNTPAVPLHVVGDARIDGNASLSANLDVGGIASFGKDVRIAGTATVATMTTALLNSTATGSFGVQDIQVASFSHIGKVAALEPMATAPSAPSLGWIYASTDTHLYFFNGTDWKQLDN